MGPDQASTVGPVPLDTLNPALLVTDTAYFRNPNYHTPNDTADTLDIGFMANSTRATVAGLAALGTLDGDGDGRSDVCA